MASQTHFEDLGSTLCMSGLPLPQQQMLRLERERMRREMQEALDDETRRIRSQCEAAKRKEVAQELDGMAEEARMDAAEKLRAECAKLRHQFVQEKRSACEVPSRRLLPRVPWPLREVASRAHTTPPSLGIEPQGPQWHSPVRGLGCP